MKSKLQPFRANQRLMPSSSKATGAISRINLTPGQQKVIQGMDRGRAIAIRNAKIVGAVNSGLVMNLALKDLNAGGSRRGRAKRIAIDLGGKLTERSVLRILAGLSVCPIPSAHTRETFKEVSK